MTVGYDGQVLIWDSKTETKSRELPHELRLVPELNKSICVTNPEGEELGLLNINLDPALSTRSFWSTTVPLH